MSTRDTAPAPALAEKVSRRELIKKALALSSVGYVAPLILGSATPASAQVVSGACTWAGCVTNNCGDGECGCTLTTEDGTACVIPFCPEPIDFCDSSSDCRVDQVCMSTAADCCDEGEGVCLYLCGASIPNGANTLQGSAGSSGWR